MNHLYFSDCLGELKQLKDEKARRNENKSVSKGLFD
jgi:hypothetical protein